MLLLFETAAGFALFKVLQENKIQETEVSQQGMNSVRGGWYSQFGAITNFFVRLQDLWKDFETLDDAQKVTGEGFSLGGLSGDLWDGT